MYILSTLPASENTIAFSRNMLISSDTEGTDELGHCFVSYFEEAAGILITQIPSVSNVELGLSVWQKTSNLPRGYTSHTTFVKSVRKEVEETIRKTDCGLGVETAGIIRWHCSGRNGNSNSNSSDSSLTVSTPIPVMGMDTEMDTDTDTDTVMLMERVTRKGRGERNKDKGRKEQTPKKPDTHYLSLVPLPLGIIISTLGLLVLTLDLGLIDACWDEGVEIGIILRSVGMGRVSEGFFTLWEWKRDRE
ncbi:hypothetical protein K435DRAFT_911870 [Dendrothele bispora CBS 962.96]|uniref:Uncharacterized protein n=1 Tax=Dendrothele bispora (strain CBS 962.96) TaxID=1314807 RepID=A0A4S8MM09_DENBC|nr:hypothetical protein K435DRAFT_911870 [Dendrothele bispora CBS 962.96]